MRIAAVTELGSLCQLTGENSQLMVISVVETKAEVKTKVGRGGAKTSES